MVPTKYMLSSLCIALSAVAVVRSAPGSKFSCPNPNGFFVHSVYCDKFYYCYKNVPKMLECPPGKFFDDKISNCGDQSTVDCGSRIKPTGNPDESADDGKEVVPTVTSLKPSMITEEEAKQDDANKTSQGDEQGLKPTTAKPNEGGDEDKDSNNDDKPDSGKDEIFIGFECPERFGVFPHPNNPRKFLHCSHYIPYVKYCSADLVFNDVLKTCDHPKRK